MSQSGSPAGTPRSSHDGGASERNRKSIEDAAIGEAENAFQKAIAVWRSIDLSSLQKQLDAEASEIITNQRDDLVERKEVAQKTKDFRKLSDPDKLVEYKGLLKAYQQFIDHISNHRKSTESLFLNVYNHLSEAPDPYPLLEATIDSLVQSEDVSRLTSENNALRTTVARLTTQNQNLESRVDELKRDVSRRDKEANRTLEKAEEGFQAVLEERSTNWEAKERSLLDKIEHQERVLKEQKASYEASLRMGKVSEGADDGMGGGASLAELEILSSDLERTSMRLTEMEHRNEQLRAQLAQALAAQNNPPGKSQEEQEELDTEVQRLETANSNLLKKIDSLKADTEVKLRDQERKERALEREVDMIKKERTVLKDKVKAWSDYDEVKRELEVLKTIEFSTGDDDEDGQAVEVEPSGQGKESLEQLLLARNKKLGNELTVLRVSHQDLSSRLEDLQKQLGSTSKELSESRSLNNQLEEDLHKVQSQASFPNPAMSVAGTYTSRYPQSQAGHFGPRGVSRVSPTSSIISGKGPQAGSFDQLRAANTEPSAGILPMLTAQRDRYKTRNAQLEDELSRTQETVTSLRQEITSLQKDNLQLYEKTRYVSSYSRQPMNSGFSSASAKTGAVGVHNNPTASSGLSLDRYRAAYEANLSPFEAFRTRESFRVYNRMGVLERVLFSLTKMVMKNRVTRNLFAGYCLLLHLLCIGVLYWAGMGETEKLGGISMSAGDTVSGAVGGGQAAGEWKAEEAPIPGT